MANSCFFDKSWAHYLRMLCFDDIERASCILGRAVDTACFCHNDYRHAFKQVFTFFCIYCNHFCFASMDTSLAICGSLCLGGRNSVLEAFRIGHSSPKHNLFQVVRGCHNCGNSYRMDGVHHCRTNNSSWVATIDTDYVARSWWRNCCPKLFVECRCIGHWFCRIN